VIFVDTGAFLARYLEKDQYHKLATNFWQTLLSDGRPCFTSNFVLDETLTLLGRWTSYKFAAERGRLLYDSSLIILRPDFNDEIAALSLFQKYADQGVSFTDCVSFVLMKNHSIPSAFAFDRHFLIAGFDVEPENP
jgi:uncharacterized protein